jgi:hypothetical protein
MGEQDAKRPTSPVYGFRWTGEYDISVDEVMNGAKQSKPESQLTKARRLIENALRYGTVLPDEMLHMADEQNICHKTFYRAKSALGVISVKHGSDWYWEMPIDVVYTDCAEDGQHGQENQNGQILALPVLMENRAE